VKTFMVILMGFIGVSAMYSQEKPASPKYALSFGIAGNFTLDKFNGSIAVKKILDDEHQLRLFVSPRVTTNNAENESGGLYKKSTDELHSYAFGGGADYLCMLMKDDDINMYGGAGLVINYGIEKYTGTSLYSTGLKYVKEDKISSRSGGLRGVLGVEWMVSKKIGIHSEYLLSGSYNWQYRESKTWTDGLENPLSKNTTTGVSVISSVLFGVSIYL